jgi:hypothetical protein
MNARTLKLASRPKSLREFDACQARFGPRLAEHTGDGHMQSVPIRGRGNLSRQPNSAIGSLTNRHAVPRGIGRQFWRHQITLLQKPAMRGRRFRHQPAHQPPDTTGERRTQRHDGNAQQPPYRRTRSPDERQPPWAFPLSPADGREDPASSRRRSAQIPRAARPPAPASRPARCPRRRDRSPDRHSPGRHGGNSRGPDVPTQIPSRPPTRPPGTHNSARSPERCGGHDSPPDHRVSYSLSRMDFDN